MSDFTHFLIVAIASMLVAGVTLKLLQGGLQGTAKQFYWNFIGGLISIGVLSVIATAIYVATLGDQEALITLCDADPLAEICRTARSRLKIPLFTGVGGMFLYFSAALAGRVNHTKKAGIR